MTQEIGGFAALGIHPSVLAAVIAVGYEEPSAIQSQAIPVILGGHDGDVDGVQDGVGEPFAPFRLRGELGVQAGLPAAFEGPSTDQVVELIGRDKKRRGDRVPFVLVDAPGEVSHGHEVDDADLRSAIEEVRAA